MTDWAMRGSPGVEVALEDGRCYITGKWGTKIEIGLEDIGRLIYLLNLACEELEANG